MAGQLLTPKVVLQRLKKVKAQVDKGKITDFSKMCEKIMRNVYVGPLLQKHGAIAKKARGKPYHWNGLALNLTFSRELLNEMKKGAKQRNKAFLQRKLDNIKKAPAATSGDKMVNEMLGNKQLKQIEELLKQGSTNKSDEKLDQIINLLQTYNENVLHMHSACLKMLNGFEVIAGQLNGITPV